MAVDRFLKQETLVCRLKVSEGRSENGSIVDIIGGCGVFFSCTGS